MNIFFTQCFQKLIREAGRNGGSRLRVPLRLIPGRSADKVKPCSSIG